jgi:hypothetical protein
MQSMAGIDISREEKLKRLEDIFINMLGIDEESEEDAQ